VPGHQKEVNFEAWGNSFTDEIVKWAAITHWVPAFCLIRHLPAPPITPTFTPPKEEQLKINGAIRTEQGEWVLPDGREIISKPLMRDVLTYLHQGSHWGP
jgi:hypothetical protein